MTQTNKIRVVVVDDSLLIRRLLTSIIDEAGDMQVVATAADPIIAREKIRETDPDVVTLDVEMPRMDGLEFLRRLMRLRPTPVVMFSSLTRQGSEIAQQAFELGAIEVLAKPSGDLSQQIHQYCEVIRDGIRAAAQARVRSVRAAGQLSPALTSAGHARVALPRDRLVFVGASTGGTEAIKDFLLGLPVDFPPVLIVQHMPAGFTASFAQRLDRCCPLRVKEAEEGEEVQWGTVYIAPGHSHMRIRPQGGGYRIMLDQSEPVNRHRPAVDVLFESAAQYVGKRGYGVILTGMGRDGAQGMLRMKEAGALTFAQDEASCVVYGMPKEAVKMGGVDIVAPLGELAGRLYERLRCGGVT